MLARSAAATEQCATAAGRYVNLRYELQSASQRVLLQTTLVQPEIQGLNIRISDSEHG